MWSLLGFGLSSWVCRTLLGLSWQLGVSNDDYAKDFPGRCWRRRAYGGDGPMAEDSPVKCEKLGLSLFGGCVCVEALILS